MTVSRGFCRGVLAGTALTYAIVGHWPSAVFALAALILVYWLGWRAERRERWLREAVRIGTRYPPHDGESLDAYVLRLKRDEAERPSRA